MNNYIDKGILDINSKSISLLINHIMTRSEKNTLYVVNCFDQSLLEDIYNGVHIIYIDSFENINCDVINKDKSLFVIYIGCNNEDKSCVMKSDILCDEIDGFYVIDNRGSSRIDGFRGIFVDLSLFSEMHYTIGLFGKTLYPNFMNYDVPDSFKVLAVIHAYNEVDAISVVIDYLLSQNLDLYLIDNWSSDGTYEIMQGFKDKYPQRIYLERFPACEKDNVFDMWGLMERTEQIAKKADYNWFIHYDADEIRESFWENVDLRKTIFIVDCLGYNLIDNNVIDFRIVDKEYQNNIYCDGYFGFRHDSNPSPQLKSWKRNVDIEVKSTAGHVAYVPYPKVFPLMILNRHYPYRSIKQAQKKVFKDRLLRSKEEFKNKGWHGHYFSISSEADFIYDSKKLLHWEEGIRNELFLQFYFFIGIKRFNTSRLSEENIRLPEFIKNKRVVVYGAGIFCRSVFEVIDAYCNIVGWVDKNAKHMVAMFGRKVTSVEELNEYNYDYIIIAIKDADVQEHVRIELVDKGIDDRCIFKV